MPGTSDWFRRRVAALEDRRAQGEGWRVALNPGWQLDGAHEFTRRTQREVWAAVDRVARCRCSDCAPPVPPDVAERTRRWLDELEL